MHVRGSLGCPALVSLALLGAGLGMASPAATQRLPKSGATEWYFIDETDGIRVYARDRPGHTLPLSRSVGEVQADFFTIAAVLADGTRHSQWMPHCMNAELLAQRGDFDQVFYQQVSAPWPVTNRDLVFRAVTEYKPRRGEMLTRFGTVSHPAYPPRDGFVRIPKLEGFYHLRALGPARTLVTLEVDADPGGLLPDWLVKMVTRKFPLDSLSNLREQILRTRGVYDAEVVRLRQAHGAYTVPSAAPKKRAGPAPSASAQP